MPGLFLIEEYFDKATYYGVINKDEKDLTKQEKDRFDYTVEASQRSEKFDPIKKDLIKHHGTVIIDFSNLIDRGADIEIGLVTKRPETYKGGLFYDNEMYFDAAEGHPVDLGNYLEDRVGYVGTKSYLYIGADPEYFDKNKKDFEKNIGQFNKKAIEDERYTYKIESDEPTPRVYHGQSSPEKFKANIKGNNEIVPAVTQMFGDNIGEYFYQRDKQYHIANTAKKISVPSGLKEIQAVGNTITDAEVKIDIIDSPNEEAEAHTQFLKDWEAENKSPIRKIDFN